MARGFLNPSRIAAVAIVAVAVLWIASGSLGPHAEETKPQAAPAAAPVAAARRVAFTAVAPEPHVRNVVLSGVTQAEKRAQAVARGAGLVLELKVARGTNVKAGDIVALLSDEGREAAVKQAQALVDQRQTDLDAQRDLIERGTLPRNQMNGLQTQLASAQAALATAKAELLKVQVRAPIDGRVENVPVEVGQAVQVGALVAEVVSPDPMLAVGQVSEKDRGALAVGQKAEVTFIDGTKATGALSFVGLTAEKTTRTYRVEAKLANADGRIADGVTAEISIGLPPVQGVSLALSSIVFADDGRLGVRIVDDKDVVHFLPLTVLGTDRGIAWVGGFNGATRVITVGQEFVKEGETVTAVPAPKPGGGA
ncbi:MAG: efflux RND transporter periplasmic adaptor subunit [Bauldia sp.]